MKLFFRLIVLFFILLVSGCGVFSGSTSIPLSQQDADKMMSKISDISLVPNIGNYAAQNKHVKIYKVAFDGTNNDKNNIPTGERRTIVAHIADLTKATYFPGPGTGRSGLSWVDSIFGHSSIQKAENAKLDLIEKTKTWLQDDPDTEVIVFVTGFSRGSAIARHFMNIVEQDWSSDLAKSSKQGLAMPRFYAVLFDTVATGQVDQLLLSIPKSLDYLVHFVAEDEMRNRLFTPIVDYDSNQNYYDFFMRLDDVPRRINTVKLPGAHSDVGASYKNGIGDFYLILVERLLVQLGLYQKTCWDIDSAMFEAGKHDSRGLFDKFLGSPQANSVSNIARDAWLVPSASLDHPNFKVISHRLIQKSLSIGHTSRTTHFNIKSHPLFLVTRNGQDLKIDVPTESVAKSAKFTTSDVSPRIEYTLSTGASLTITIPDELFFKFPEGIAVNFSTFIFKKPSGSEIIYYFDEVKVLSLPISDAETIESPSIAHSCSNNINQPNPKPVMIIRPNENGFEVIPLN